MIKGLIEDFKTLYKYEGEYKYYDMDKIIEKVLKNLKLLRI